MVRALFLFALIIAAASAFVSPASNALSNPAFTRVEAPKMSFDEVADIATSSIAQSSQMVASNAGDFGGALFPVFGLVALGAVILVLAPPLADE